MNRLDVSDFPDSAFARELGVGDVRLRFEPELESAYQRAHLQRVHTRVRLWSALSAVVAIFFSGVLVVRMGLGSREFWLQILCNLPCALAPCWLAWCRY